MKRRLVKTLKTLGYTAIVLAVIYAFLLTTGNIALKRAYKALESEGRPMQAEELIPPEIPATQNAALIYEAVMLQLKSEPAGDEGLFSALDDCAADMLEESHDTGAEEQFRRLAATEVAAQAIASLQRGAKKSGCRFDVDYGKGIEALLPHVSYIRNLSRILCANASLQSADGDHAQAWDTLITSLHVADSVRSEPILISQLVRIAAFGVTVDTLQAIAADALPSDRQYEEIVRLLDSFASVEPLVTSFDGERLLFGESMFNRDPRWLLAGLNGGAGDRAPPVVAISLFTPLLRHNHAAYLNVMRVRATDAALPYSGADSRQDRELLENIPRYCFLARMIVPALNMAKRRYVSVMARASVTRAGLAALRYRQEKGVYPASLDVLGRDDLVDPFTGRTLAYETAPNGFLVYSIGENLVNDKGTVGKTKDEGDIVWRHPDSPEE